MKSWVEPRRAGPECERRRLGAGFGGARWPVGGGQCGGPQPRWAVGDPVPGGSRSGQPEGFRAGRAVRGFRMSTRVRLRFDLVRGYIRVWGVFNSFKWWVGNIWQQCSERFVPFIVLLTTGLVDNWEESWAVYFTLLLLWGQVALFLSELLYRNFERAF